MNVPRLEERIEFAKKLINNNLKAIENNINGFECMVEAASREVVANNQRYYDKIARIKEDIAMYELMMSIRDKENMVVNVQTKKPLKIKFIFNNNGTVQEIF